MITYLQKSKFMAEFLDLFKREVIPHLRSKYVNFERVWGLFKNSSSPQECFSILDFEVSKISNYKTSQEIRLTQMLRALPNSTALDSYQNQIQYIEDLAQLSWEGIQLSKFAHLNEQALSILLSEMDKMFPSEDKLSNHYFHGRYQTASSKLKNFVSRSVLLSLVEKMKQRHNQLNTEKDIEELDEVLLLTTKQEKLIGLQKYLYDWESEELKPKPLAVYFQTRRRTNSCNPPTPLESFFDNSVVFAFVSFVIFLNYSFLTFTFTFENEELGMGEELSALLSLVSHLGGLVAGFFQLSSNKVKKVASVGCVIAAAGNLVYILGFASKSLGVLLLGRFLIGCGMMTGANMKIMRHCEKETEKQRHANLVIFSLVSGLCFGPVLGFILIQVSYLLPQVRPSCCGNFVCTILLCFLICFISKYCTDLVPKKPTRQTRHSWGASMLSLGWIVVPLGLIETYTTSVPLQTLFSMNWKHWETSLLLFSAIFPALICKFLIQRFNIEMRLLMVVGYLFGFCGGFLLLDFTVVGTKQLVVGGVLMCFCFAICCTVTANLVGKIGTKEAGVLLVSIQGVRILSDLLVFIATLLCESQNLVFITVILVTGSMALFSYIRYDVI